MADKSVNDPCPYGWRVAPSGAFDNLAIVGTPAVGDEAKYGWTLTDGNAESFFIGAGRRRYDNGKILNLSLIHIYAGTAFEILSIDIADIDVGKNIGAQLQMDQAQADKNIAQAKAEERRAMAVALEQENKAKAQDARAKVILAEAEVPLAMAEAFRNGNLGIMDYYKMKNIMADTSMRETIARPEKK